MKYAIIKKCFILCVSMMIIPSLHSMEATPQTPTVGLSGWLYTQSWVLSKPQLLLYAFEHSLFDHKNKTHKDLVRSALLVCRTNKDIETLEKILIFIDKNFYANKILRVATARSTHDFLTTRQTGHNVSTHTQLADTQKSQLTQISGHIEKLHGNIIVLMTTLDGYKKVQEEQLEAFRTNYCTNRNLTFLLHKLNQSIDSQEDLENCSDVDNDGELVAPSLRDVAYINKKVMATDNQFGKDNVLFLSLLQQLDGMEKATTQLLALCGQEK